MKNNWKPTLPPFRAHKKQSYIHSSKTSQFIYQLGEGTTIREKSKEIPVNEITSQTTRQKIAYLKKCMLKYRKITGMGRGIAAVQVGIVERLAVIYLPAATTNVHTEKHVQKQLMVIINPVIQERAKTMLRFPEGCMSEGPIFAPVVRPAWIAFSYYDEQGNKQYWDTKDTDIKNRIYNRVFQHEIDHMDGTIFLDKADLSGITLDSDPAFYDTAKFEQV